MSRFYFGVEVQKVARAVVSRQVGMGMGTSGSAALAAGIADQHPMLARLDVAHHDLDRTRQAVAGPVGNEVPPTARHSGMHEQLPRGGKRLRSARRRWVGRTKAVMLLGF